MRCVVEANGRKIAPTGVGYCCFAAQNAQTGVLEQSLSAHTPKSPTGKRTRVEDLRWAERGVANLLWGTH